MSTELRTVQQTGAVVPAKGAARSIAATVLANEERLLEPERVYRELMDIYCGARKASDAANSREEAQIAIISPLPSVEHMEQLADRIGAVATVEPDDRVNRILVGLMVDSFPSARIAHGETFIEALLQDLRNARHPPAVVAHACRTLRQTKTFVPSISEALEACTKSAEELQRWPGTVAFVASRKREAIQRLDRLRSAANSGGEQ